MSDTTTTPTPAPEDLESADQLSRELVRFIRLINYFKSHVAPVARTNGVEGSAFPILGRLVHGGPQRMTLLAEAVHSDLSTVSRQVSALVTQGLVERQADPEDGRACRLAATEHGLGVFEDLRRTRNEHIAMILVDWSEEDKSRLVELMHRFNTGMEGHGPRLGNQGDPSSRGAIQ